MTTKRLIIFTDCGDTIIDEATQVYDDRHIVQEARCIPGADAVLRQLHREGFPIVAVADGEVESFGNIFRENGLAECFDAWVISEVVGLQKPAPIMFETALEKMGLTQADRYRIVMIGNNLKKDVAGANRMGITSIWLDWSPRYFHTVEEPDWQPDYTVHTPDQLIPLLHRLNDALEPPQAPPVPAAAAEDKLERLLAAFCPILYEDDVHFMENMKDKNLAGDDIRKYQHWEWPQGVGLYGLWRLFDVTREQKYLDILTGFFRRQMEVGFPALNVNTAAPYLTMSYLGEYLGDEDYLRPCREAAAWIMAHFPRTEEGGFQHQTSDSVNDQELWDDTLFMTVLFLANMGRIEGKRAYIEEAQRQFLLHAAYLADRETGLWYHGWTFKGRHNFARAFWGRGNCWITIAIPELLDMVECDPPVRAALTDCLQAQIAGLARHQDPSGMWHTLIDDPTSYVEASASCGFAYGILRAVKTGLVPGEYRALAYRALPPILACIGADGVVGQVSYGTPMGRESKDFYKHIPLQPMPYGQAMAMLLLNEYLRP